MNKLIIQNDPTSVFYEKGFLIMLESFLQTIIAGSPAYAIDQTTSDIYICDFYGLLKALKVNDEYLYITMRVNGFRSPYDYKGGLSQVLIPNPVVLETYRNEYMTGKK